jgi:Tol biopolymer transport system component
MNIPELNTPGSDGNLSVTSDDLTAVWNTNWPDLGASDVWYAQRSTREEAFGTARPLPGVSGAGGDVREPSISADGCELLFASVRAGSMGLEDLYVARYVPPQ